MDRTPVGASLLLMCCCCSPSKGGLLRSRVVALLLSRLPPHLPYPHTPQNGARPLEGRSGLRYGLRSSTPSPRRPPLLAGLLVGLPVGPAWLLPAPPWRALPAVLPAPPSASRSSPSHVLSSSWSFLPSELQPMNVARRTPRDRGGQRYAFGPGLGVHIGTTIVLPLPSRARWMVWRRFSGATTSKRAITCTFDRSPAKPEKTLPSFVASTTAMATTSSAAVPTATAAAFMHRSTISFCSRVFFVKPSGMSSAIPHLRAPQRTL